MFQEQGLSKELIKEQKVNVKGKHEGHFFENVLMDIAEKGYLTETMMQRIQLDLINLWKDQIESYNAGKSSSITETKAKKLLESIYQTLGFRLRALVDLDDSIALLQYRNIKTLFQEGQELMEERFEKLKVQYNNLKSHLLKIDNMAYRDTYDKGLEPFFKLYSLKFESQECPCSIDYPLSNDPMELMGLEYMVSYIEKSLLEHELCLKFETKEIEALLKGYHEGYQEINLNIFELVLMNLIGRLIVGKDTSHLTLETDDMIEIERKLEILPSEVLEKTLKQKAVEVLEQLGLTSLELRLYTMQTISRYVPRIELVLENEKLETIFIVTKCNLINRMQYKGGRKLSHAAFKTLSEMVRDCQDIESKIKLIKEKVKHVEDLKDLLEADCIFDKEYGAIYASLEDVELALLLNMLRIDDYDILEMDIDQEWVKYLKQYMESLNLKRQQTIRRIEQKIKFC